MDKDGKTAAYLQKQLTSLGNEKFLELISSEFESILAQYSNEYETSLNDLIQSVNEILMSDRNQPNKINEIVNIIGGELLVLALKRKTP